MINNPFIISGKIVRKYFCDREKESEELIRRLTNGQNIVLISPRRMGKTGLIDYCFEDERIKNHYYTFFIDILQTNTLNEFIFLLGKEIFSALLPRSRRLAMGFVQALKSLSGKITFDTISGIPSFNIQLGDITRPEITLEEIFNYLEKADKHCFIAIDEFQQIVNYPEKNIEAILRTHIQHCSNCNFIFSGSRRHILQEMFVSTAKPFFNSATFMHLDAIPEDKYVNYIVELFKERGRFISTCNAKAIYDRFEGHTYYVQRVCNEAFSSTPEGSECDGQIINAAIANILDSYATIFREILSQLPVKQKQLLYAIATTGKAARINSEDFIKLNSLSSASSVQSAARMLMNKEMITKADETYSLTDRFFQLWIKQMLN